MRQKREEGQVAALGDGRKDVLLWLRVDLRLHDHPALDAAAKKARTQGGKLAFAFVHSPEEDGDDLKTGELIISVSKSLHMDVLN